MSQTQPTKGFVIVATCDYNFYSLAMNLADSILDVYPEAKITLFTEEQFIDRRVKELDNVIFCDSHYRAKLYALANAPYDITMYIDADAEVQHEDIATVFDRLEDNDMVFTPINKENEFCFHSRYLSADKSEDNAFKLHGAICLFDNRKPLVREFMNDWWEYYQKQFSGDWWIPDENGNWDTSLDQRTMKNWDQTTLWYLTTRHEKYKSLKIGIFDDWLRWNWQLFYYKKEKFSNYIDEHPIVIHHMSANCNKWDDPSYKDIGLAEI